MQEIINLDRQIMIQPFEPIYQDQVIKHILHIQRNEFGVNITLEHQLDLKEILQVYQTNNGNFWIAIDNNKVIGTIALLDIGNAQAALKKLFVAQDYRGKEKGIAKKLLDTLLAWAKDHKIKEVFLGTIPIYFAAHRFYEKNGFIEIKKEELPTNFPVMEVDKKFYTFTIL
jgi:N-acetylglutamate synthase-like GNAT family acetyltransferase